MSDLTFSIFKGSRELLWDLPTAEAVEVALVAAHREDGHGIVRVVRSDGALMTHDQDGRLEPEADWLARFLARAQKLEAECARIVSERAKGQARSARYELERGKRDRTEEASARRAVARFDARRASEPRGLTTRAPAPRVERPVYDNPCGKSHAAPASSCEVCQAVEQRMRDTIAARKAARAPWKDAKPFDAAATRRTG